MSLVTMGMGGSSLLVTGGMGHKDTITTIIDDNLGGANRKNPPKLSDLSLLRYSFTVPVDAVQQVVDEFDEESDSVAMSRAVSNFLADKVIELDGTDYTIMVAPDDVRDLVDRAKDLDAKLQTIMREVDVTRKKAKRMLIDRARKEMAAVIKHQREVFDDDMDIIEILLLADEL